MCFDPSHFQLISEKIIDNENLFLCDDCSHSVDGECVTGRL